MNLNEAVTQYISTLTLDRRYSALVTLLEDVKEELEDGADVKEVLRWIESGLRTYGRLPHLSAVDNQKLDQWQKARGV